MVEVLSIKGKKLLKEVWMTKRIKEVCVHMFDKLSHVIIAWDNTLPNEHDKIKGISFKDA